LVDASISENHTVSVFKAEVAMLGSGGIYIGLHEGKAEGVDQSGTTNERGMDRSTDNEMYFLHIIFEIILFKLLVL
jgi:hypothetical protein